LLVVRKNPDKYEEIQRYRVADGQTWAQPVLLKNGVVIRAADAVSFWKLQ
jgi:hypothetical protein